MKLLALGAEELAATLPMSAAVAAMTEAFAALSAGNVAAPPRMVLDVEPAGGKTLLMGAAVRAQGLAVKVVSVFERNADRGRPAVNGLVLVLDPDTGEPAAVCDGTYLTALRTGAASGAATALLARGNARVGAVVGCGAQARTQLLGIDCVRDLERIRVCSLRWDQTVRFVEEMQQHARARLEPVRFANDALPGADVVCTATNSPSPVFDGSLLVPGAHVNGVGSYTLQMREIDGAAVARSRVFVDSIESALAEAGDLVIAQEEGVTVSGEWTELGRVAAGTATGRRADDEITLFKSVGHAVQDVFAASRAVQRARELGLGREWEL